MSERPTLTVSVPCPTCEYVLWVATPSGMQPTKQHAPKCPDCTDGTISTPVSCAGCKWWNHGHYCAKKDIFNCEPEFGCLSWEAKA